MAASSTVTDAALRQAEGHGHADRSGPDDHDREGRVAGGMVSREHAS